ncbi:expressed unknown protein [Seminavis robusta]|uniref:Uncharacterized protein n=1 Tax=Seminavis robusta TaxID=568900 RepID=A0A9N8HJM6_9STRA|nr:expressed unknown protein [Seminavis robusta]|eukprot:Sro561_g166800.1 n/a (220) ;mRNA; f:32515-33387
MSPFAFYAVVVLITTCIAAVVVQPKKESTPMTSPLRQAVQCKCGKVQLAIDSPSALRFVCYSKDYRGYYNSLNELAKEKNKEPNAVLDSWGGVDLTQIYPSEISVKEGSNLLTPTLIREGSPVRRVYASCCDTPMFDIGSAAALINTDLLEETNKPAVKFRILGRHALSNDKEKAPPNMSWSVPFGWFWTMPGRIQKDKMEPTPIDLSSPQILKNFKEG